MRNDLCICSSIPHLKIKTKISILMHGLELHKTTSTVRLLKLAIPEVDIKLFGKLGINEELEVPGNVSPLVLFPEASAPVLDLEYVSQLAKPVMLIVPDGTWTQARKLIHKRSNLYSVPRVRVQRDTPSKYKLRRNQHEGGMCTLEAIAEALAVLEGHDISDALLALLDLMVERVMWSRNSSGSIVERS